MSLKSKTCTTNCVIQVCAVPVLVLQSGPSDKVILCCPWPVMELCLHRLLVGLVREYMKHGIRNHVATHT